LPCLRPTRAPRSLTFLSVNVPTELYRNLRLVATVSVKNKLRLYRPSNSCLDIDMKFGKSMWWNNERKTFR